MVAIFFLKLSGAGNSFRADSKKSRAGAKCLRGACPRPDLTPLEDRGGGEGTLTSPFKQTREPRYGHKIVRAKESVQNYVMWSRVLKCSVKLYMIGSSSSWVVSIHAGPHT